MNDTRKHIEVTDESHMHHEGESEKEYGKLVLVFAVIVAITLVVNLAIDGHGPFRDLTPTQAVISQFMGVFFLVFASFKLINLSSFVHGFAMYDVIAKRSNQYAYCYPFLQLGVGVAMFVFPSQMVTQASALILSGIALVGVVLSLRQKKEFQCACLGNVIKMPLATVSGIEDGLMFVLSLLMLISMIG